MWAVIQRSQTPPKGIQNLLIAISQNTQQIMNFRHFLYSWPVCSLWAKVWCRDYAAILSRFRSRGNYFTLSRCHYSSLLKHSLGRVVGGLSSILKALGSSPAVYENQKVNCRQFSSCGCCSWKKWHAQERCHATELG